MLTWSVFSIIHLIGIGYKYYQDRATELGGKIAWCKSIWLTYTIYTWFLLPIIFYYTRQTEALHILIPISISFWIRGIIELFMLFVTKNWKPIYGITHNLFTIFLGLWMGLGFDIRLNLPELLFITSIFIGLGLETYYAYFFHKNVGKKTEGEKGVWFANKEDPTFKRVLQVTTIGNFVVYAGLIFFLLN